MEFDKSRVYTVLNADELEVGSMVIVADNLKDLKAKVLDGYEDMQHRLIKIGEERFQNRFFTTENLAWALAYLVSPSDNQLTAEYEPFSDMETAYEAINLHGGWVINEDGAYFAITGINIGPENREELLVGQHWYSAESIFESCIFADDGSLVGQRIEDSDTKKDGAT